MSRERPSDSGAAKETNELTPCHGTFLFRGNDSTGWTPRASQGALLFCSPDKMSALGRLCCKSRRYLVRSPKTDNIRIQRADSMNQYSPLTPESGKMFFALRPKIFLQQNGQQRTCRLEIALSALPPKADSRPLSRNVRLGPNADISFDHLVGN